VEDLRQMHPKPVGKEMQTWPRRLDESIDNIAYNLGLTQIPYKSTSDSPYRYVAPYRLEMLEEAIKEHVTPRLAE
jgi:hypothetical protein